MLETNLFATVTKRAEQFALKIREVKMIANRLILYIDGSPEQLTGQVAFAHQQSLARQRADIINWPHGSLTDLNVRTELARQWPGSYANAAAVQTETQAVNGAFIALQAALDALIVAEVDTQTTLELALTAPISSPETDALRAAAVIVRNSINGPV